MNEHPMKVPQSNHLFTDISSGTILRTDNFVIFTVKRGANAGKKTLPISPLNTKSQKI